MKTTFVAAFLFLAGATGALAAPASGAASAQASADLSGAVGQSVGNGAAIVGVSVAMPMMAVGGLGEAIATASFDQLKDAGRAGRPLPVTDKTVLRGPAPDQALKARQ
ncbi:MAG: hypothetical protein Q8J92_09625 [Parvibaculum sp.]|nr:hypothetical protein [Parvibaculum sp.]